MMRHAEHISFLHNRSRLAVIAGVGTRKYYEKLGYTKSRSGGEYMMKSIHPTTWARLVQPAHRLHFLLFGHDPDRTGVPSYKSWMPSILAFLVGLLGIILAVLGLFL
jgi:hypothetical protein